MLRENGIVRVNEKGEESIPVHDFLDILDSVSTLDSSQKKVLKFFIYKLNHFLWQFILKLLERGGGIFASSPQFILTRWIICGAK